MACKSFTLSGIGLPCKDNMGGIKEVYIAKVDDIANINVAEGAEHYIDSITLKQGSTFKTFKFRKGTASMTSSATSDDQIGNFSVTTELSLQFSKMDTGKRMEIMALCLEECVAIVLDFNGQYWYLGYDSPISATAATAQTGQAATDLNGYTVTLSDTSAVFPYPIIEEVIKGKKNDESGEFEGGLDISVAPVA